MVTEAIKDILYDYIILTGGVDEDYVYSSNAVPEITKFLNDGHYTNSVFTYPINDTAYDNPDRWCAVTWMEAGELHTFGFNYMTKERVDKFETFNEVMNNPFNGYYGH